MKRKINRYKHKFYVKSIGMIGNKAIEEILGLPALGVFENVVKRYDSREGHKNALKKSYLRMKRNPKLTTSELSNAYYKDRRSSLIRNGLFKLGIIKQYFKK